MDLQQKFQNAFDNYLDLSKIMKEDLEFILEKDDGSNSWKRNFIRSSLSIIEGYCHCYREYCQIAIKTGHEFSSKRTKVILNERNCTASERIKYTIQSVYEAFKLDELPDFSSQEWKEAEKAIKKRDSLMHPQTVDDFKMSDAEWSNYYHGIVWLIQVIFSFFENVAIKYDGYKPNS